MERKLRPPTIVVSDWEEGQGTGAIPKRTSIAQVNTTNYVLPYNTRLQTSSSSSAAEVDFISAENVSNEEQNETTMADLSSDKCPEGSSAHMQSKFDLNLSHWSSGETPVLQKSQRLPNSSTLGYEMPVTEFTGKIRRKKSRLHCRRKAVAYQKSPLGHDIQGEKRLRQAVQQGNREEVQTILQEGTNPNRADDKGRAAIHFGVRKGHKEIVQLLLDGGSDINQKDGVGNTPLHLACIGSQIEMVTVLLEAGANCHELDGSGHTPIHIVKSRIPHLRGSLSEATKLKVLKLFLKLRPHMGDMACTGRQEHISKLDSVSEKLQINHPQKEIDKVQDIQESLTKMNL